MKPAACCSLVAFTFLCHVQCQWVPFVENDIDLKHFSTTGLLTSDSGRNRRDLGGFSGATSSRPTTTLVLRRGRVLEDFTRRNLGYNTQYYLSTVGVLSPSSSDSWQQQSDIWKASLKTTDYFFSIPRGLKISIPDSIIDARIVNFRIKVNEEFGNNDGGHYAPDGYRRGGFTTYNVPQLRANQGDKIYFLMRVKLGEEEFDTIVKGVLTITQGDSQGGGYGIRTTPPTNIRPQTSTAPSFFGDPWESTGSQQALSLEQSFTINSTFSAGSEESADKWLQYFRKKAREEIEFQFLNPRGLNISTPGNTKNVKILAFNLKLNEVFYTLGPGHYKAIITSTTDGRWSFYFPNLKIKEGDKIYYWMSVKLGNPTFDLTVIGVLAVKQGDPHIGGPAPAPLETPPPPTKRPTLPPTKRPTTPHTKPPTLPPTKPPTLPPTKPPTSPPTRPPTSPPTKPPTPPPTKPPTTTSTPSPPTRPCDRSRSTARRGGVTTRPCQGSIMMEHQFNSLNGWSHQISIGGNTTEDEFTCFINYEKNTWVQQGRLNIKPTLLEDRYNVSYVRNGDLFLPGCTLFKLGSEYCHRKATGYNILPPVESARISTRSSFAFQYGTVEIRAKLPRGDWIVPELWLEPTNSSVMEKIVLGVCTGNTGETSNKLSAGVLRASDDSPTLKDITGRNPWFEAGTRTYKMEWTPDYVKFFVDEWLIHELPSESFSIFSQEVYISLGVHAGGFRDFPDEIYRNKPWNNSDVKRIARFWEAKAKWYPSWRIDPTLQVEYIRVTAL